jgi:hypothetical protein
VLWRGHHPGFSLRLSPLDELAGECGDLAELRRLADGGSSDAADALTELDAEEDKDPDEDEGDPR